jgi:hypothetical protein
MTAEIAVMNNHAVALAADSAVTLTGGDVNVKIFTSANKIFTASKYQPVGVMVFGNASLMRMPWETLVKVFRSELGDTCFDELIDYADCFLEWLQEHGSVGRAEQATFVTGRAAGMAGLVKNEFNDRVGDYVEEHGEIDLKASRPLLAEALKGVEDWVKDAPDRILPQDFDEQLLEEFSDEIDEMIAAVFEEYPLTAPVRQRVRRLCLAPILKILRPHGDTGIVFAGFGSTEFLPHLREYYVDAVLLGEVIAHPGREMDISTDHEGEAYISGFAQDEMIHLFMEGVLPNYEAFVEGYLERVIEQFNETLLDGFGDDVPEGTAEALAELQQELAGTFAQDLYQRRYAESIEPVLDIVASLPKDELAALAESLVNLTSLKKRISRDDETVGGPVDVAVISKGDGLVWIKRKHYFSPDLNQHFFANYFRPPGGQEDTDD